MQYDKSSGCCSFRRVSQLRTGVPDVFFAEVFPLNDGTLQAIRDNGDIYSFQLTNHYENNWNEIRCFRNIGLQFTAQSKVCRAWTAIKDDKLFYSLEPTKNYDTKLVTTLCETNAGFSEHEFPKRTEFRFPATWYQSQFCRKHFAVWGNTIILSLKTNWNSRKQVVVFDYAGQKNQDVQILGEGTTQNDHPCVVQRVRNDEIWISNGKHILVFYALSSNTVQIKDAHKEDILNIVPWKDSVVTVAGKTDLVVKVWLDKQVIMELKHKYGLSAQSTSTHKELLFTSDATANNSYVHIWNWNGEKIATLCSPHDYRVESVCVWKNFLVTSGADGFLILWKGREYLKWN